MTRTACFIFPFEVWINTNVSPNFTFQRITYSYWGDSWVLSVPMMSLAGSFWPWASTRTYPYYFPPPSDVPLSSTWYSYTAVPNAAGSGLQGFKGLEPLTEASVGMGSVRVYTNGGTLGTCDLSRLGCMASFRRASSLTEITSSSVKPSSCQSFKCYWP